MEDVKWFDELTETLESGRRYCFRSIFWADHQVGYERLYRFVEKNGYCLLPNKRTRKYEIYNFKRINVRSKFPELSSLFEKGVTTAFHLPSDGACTGFSML